MSRFILAAVVVVALVATATPASAGTLPLEGRIIGIDPGHGGSESGATFAYGDGTMLREKDVNLAVAQALRARLVNDRATVVMTREDDRRVSLNERCDLAAKGKAEVLVSVHHNALDNPNIDGIETFYTQPNDKAIAQLTYDELLREFRLPERGVKKSNCFALTVRPKMLSTITEAYFISNPGEAAKFYGANVANYGNLAVVQREANALYSALVSYFTR